jgi:molybdopterin converting factor small subunit
MILTVEMFGLSPVTNAASVEIELSTRATLVEVVRAIADKMPALVGRVIEKDRSRLVETYGFYVNGQFTSDDPDLRLKDGDRVVLLLLATGG